MNVLDLFCGTKSVKEISDKRDWKYTGLDIEKKFNPEICVDFLDWDYTTYDKDAFDIIWSSPDCAVFSLASGGTHFGRDRIPKTDKARKQLLIIQKLKEVLDYFNCPFIIENPRARLKWFITEYPKYEVWYCRYGFNRAKPTNIWTDLKGFVPRKCNNGNPDHISAPRGSRTSTQALPYKERYKVPPQLINELFDLVKQKPKKLKIVKKFTR